MITVRLMGGLGNQIFQLTAMMFLRSIGRASCCDSSYFQTQDLGGVTPRSVEIDRLLRAGELRRLPKRVAAVVYSPRSPRAFRERGADDDLLARLPSRFAWTMGYFQDAKYPIRMRDELAERLLPALDAFTPGAGPTAAIGMHVRLGDYVTSANTRGHHGVTGVEYFVNALSELPSGLAGLPVHVFTDSPDLFRAEYQRYVPGDVQTSDSVGSWESLAGLSSCSAIVMSNSSFSWWASFIATNLRGRAVPVVMPTPWFALESAADQLLRVDGWRSIRREPTES